MTIFDTIILGIVEGLTEFLPISSTAHLLLIAHVLAIQTSSLVSTFIIAIQLGAILAIVLVYWKTIFLDFETMKRVVVAFIPTAVIGFLLYKIIKGFLFENFFIIACALFLGGIVLIVFEKLREGRPLSLDGGTLHMPYTTAFLIGCAQSLAVIPGVSRAGATIIGGLSLGVSREKIVEFSFLLAIPTMLAATSYDLLKSGFVIRGGEWALLSIGFVVSAIFALVSVRFLIRFIQTHSFAVFGWYRILLGGAVLVWILALN